MFPSAKQLDITALGCLLPQNGVAEAAMSLPGSMDAHNGNCQQNRPSALPVNNDHQKGDYEDNTSDGGSLPGTPESDSELEMSAYSAEEGEVLESVTRQLVTDLYNQLTGISKPKWNQSQALTTMRRVVENLLEKHRYAYNGMINRLSLDDRGDDVTFVTSVAISLFNDGTTNWGRIAGLIAFGAVVCQYLKTKGRENCIERVGQEISTYLLSGQRVWLIKNNSWDGFVEFFKVDDTESKVRNTLMAVAGIAGIGATLAMLIRAGRESVLRSALSAVAVVAGVGATVAWMSSLGEEDR